MARLDQLPEPEQSFLRGLECPTFETHPWVGGPPLAERRVALISTAGLHPLVNLGLKNDYALRSRRASASASARKRPVIESACRTTSSGVPCTTTCPPSSAAPGPKSMM